ncbi:MAG: hypothetical protein IT450_11200 [Phycisphaerales bacterium]|nr:hypothetical protein [Phycisphaerales bacterium]
MRRLVLKICVIGAGAVLAGCAPASQAGGVSLASHLSEFARDLVRAVIAALVL